ncbi:MAG: hypothetical protein ACREPR_15215, partial [Brasilonema sp.]
LVIGCARRLLVLVPSLKGWATAGYFITGKCLKIFITGIDRIYGYGSNSMTVVILGLTYIPVPLLRKGGLRLSGLAWRNGIGHTKR